MGAAKTVIETLLDAEGAIAARLGDAAQAALNAVLAMFGA